MKNRLQEFTNALGGPVAGEAPQSWEDVQERMKPLLERVRKTIADYPGPSLAAAVTVGVLLGCLIKRR